MPQNNNDFKHNLKSDFKSDFKSNFDHDLGDLLDNAVQYADAGGWIEVKLEKSSRRVRLTLRNSVSRLPDCPPERLFERFYRGDSARTQGTAGCGVGLSAAQSIVEAHKGRIALSYEDAHILRVSVELPI